MECPFLCISITIYKRFEISPVRIYWAFNIVQTNSVRLERNNRGENENHGKACIGIIEKD